jgi:hypothetical protein
METAQTPFTANDWATWLAQEENRLRKVYLISPGHLIAEHRREREITRGYHGREILELLQNAGDAAKNAGVRGRVRIVVTQQGVVMGNTGCPFDQGGVESLLTANLSPKRERETVVIGDKGLGFRAILNWTDAPVISSGGLSLAFLPNYAAEVLRGLEEESDDLAKRIAAEREIGGDLIVPRLAFPQWIPDWTKHPWPEGAGLPTIAEACKHLRGEGFATAIGMPFAEKRSYEEAVRQVDELSPEFLLLVESIDRLEIKIEGRLGKVWTCEPSNQRRTIREGDKVLSCWRVSTFDGMVPEDLLDHAEKTKNRFKFTIAVPDAGLLSPGRFFCYFPTDAELPLPLLAHATVELDETRKHVNETRANRYILACLAEQIAELAEQYVGQPGQDDWAGCRLITPSAAWSGELQRLGFADALKKAARRKKLVPVLGGGHQKAEEAILAPGDETKWWPQRLFPEIAAYSRKQDRNMALMLGVEPLLEEQIVNRLLEVSDLTMEERAYALAGLLQTNKQPVSDSLSILLCDETGHPLPKGVSAMLQPTGDLPPLPEWATIRFLHAELRQQLERLLKTSDNRDLQQKLKPLGVVEYSLAALIRPVLAEANRRVRETSDEESRIRGEALVFLLLIHRGIDTGTPFPSDASMKLPTQTGEWASPKSLYLGEGYGQTGNITQDLYYEWAKGKLIERPHKLGVEADIADLTRFLEWLGVARWPREEPETQIEKDFVTLVKDWLRYPVNFDDYRFDNRQQLRRAWIADAKTVDGLPEILKNATPEAVLAWMALDSRVAAWSRPAPEHGKLKIRPHRAWNDRTYDGSIPSYTHWQISNVAWLPTADGKKTAPRHCLLGDRQFEMLFPQPRQPDKILEQRYGVFERIADCYIRAGVMPGLGRLGHDELYKLLLEVPSLSPDGKSSRALCRWFLLNETELLGFPGEYQNRFFKEGQIWGAKDEHAGYFKISELRHVDLDGMPSALLKRLPIADLPKRVGAEKVKRILGITALDRASIRQELISCRISPLQVERESWFREAKPAIKRLRQTKTKQAQALGAFERLELVICDELHVRMEYEGTFYDQSVSEGEWYIFSDKLHVRGDLDDSIDLLADAAGMAIAAVFGIAEGDAFAKILQCQPKNRGKLLKRMCGDDFHEEMEAARVSPGPAYAGPINPLGPPVTGDGRTSENTPGNEEGLEREESGEGAEGENARTLGVSPIPHVAQPPSESRKLIVRKVQRAAGNASGRRQMVDGDKCEKMALAFEEQNDPPRFALGVGHITGEDAPGFDLVSFDSSEDRDVFQIPETRVWSKVRRFIEVKGRSSSTARIDLKGNELNAARKYGDRYYLYRFYEPSDGQYLVSILKNPLAAEEAKAQIIEVDLDRAYATQRFEFIVEADIGEQRADEMYTLPIT